MAAPFNKTQGSTIGYGSTGSPVTYTTLQGVTAINENPNAASEIDTTDLSSTAMEYTGGLPDEGTVQLDINWAQDNTGHKQLDTLRASGETRKWKITDTDASPKTTTVFDGFVQNITKSRALNSVIKAQVTIRVTGPKVIT